MSQGNKQQNNCFLRAIPKILTLSFCTKSRKLGFVLVPSYRLIGLPTICLCLFLKFTFIASNENCFCLSLVRTQKRTANLAHLHELRLKKLKLHCKLLDRQISPMTLQILEVSLQILNVTCFRLFCLHNEKNRKVPLYSIFINPTNLNEFAVGGRDQFARQVLAETFA